MCRYKLATYWQKFIEIYLARVKILQKVLGGYYFDPHMRRLCYLYNNIPLCIIKLQIAVLFTQVFVVMLIEQLLWYAVMQDFTARSLKVTRRAPAIILALTCEVFSSAISGQLCGWKAHGASSTVTGARGMWNGLVMTAQWHTTSMSSTFSLTQKNTSTSTFPTTSAGSCCVSRWHWKTLCDCHSSSRHSSIIVSSSLPLWSQLYEPSTVISISDW